MTKRGAEVDPSLPIYDLQMKEGPQIKARLLMRELLQEEFPQKQQPRVIHGSAFKISKKNSDVV